MCIGASFCELMWNSGHEPARLTLTRATLLIIIFFSLSIFHLRWAHERVPRGNELKPRPEMAAFCRERSTFFFCVKKKNKFAAIRNGVTMNNSSISVRFLFYFFFACVSRLLSICCSQPHYKAIVCLFVNIFYFIFMCCRCTVFVFVAACRRFQRDSVRSV